MHAIRTIDPFCALPVFGFGNSAQNRFVGRGSLQNGWAKNRQTDNHHTGGYRVYVSMCACLACLCAQKYKRGGEVRSGNKMSSGLCTKISDFTSSCNLSCLISRRARWGRIIARKNSHPIDEVCQFFDMQVSARPQQVPLKGFSSPTPNHEKNTNF